MNRSRATSTTSGDPLGGVAPGGARSERVEVRDGVTLRTLVRPGSNPVRALLVHGLASNARLWDGVGRELESHGIGSVAVDLRGHGESDRPTGGYDFEQVGGDLLPILRSWAGTWVLAGQSWGGNVVLDLAARAPEGIVGLVLVDGGFIKLSDSFPDEEAAVSALRPPDLVGVTRRRLDEGAAEHYPGFPREGVEAQRANFEPMGNGRYRPRLRLDDHLDIVRSLYRQDPDAIADRVDLPVTVLAVGDPGTRPRVDAFARHLARGRVRWVEGHHDIHAQRPDVVADAIEEMVP